MNTNLFRTFVKYVSLNVCGMIGLSCYILADTYFVAQGVGATGLTALNLVLPPFSFMNAIGLMLGMGGATKYAHFLGAGEIEKGNALFSRTIIFGLIAGIIMTIIGLGSNQLVAWLGADETVQPYASVYLLTLYSFACAFVLNNIVSAFVRNDGGPQRAMIAMLCGNLFNIVFDYIFIIELDMGMFGAAFATGFSPALSLLILSGHWRKKHTLHFSIHSRISCFKNILLAGLPSFITEFASGILILLFNFTFIRFGGNTAVAAYGIIANLALIVVAAFTGVAQGIQPIVGVNFGAGNLKNANLTYFWAICTALGMGTFCYIIGRLFSQPIVAVFNESKDTVLAAIAENGMELYFIAFFIMGVNIVTCAFLSSVAQFRASLLVSLCRACFISIPLLYIMPAIWGITGVWLVVPVTETLTLLVAALSMRSYLKLGARF